jgi:hypothetical protein
VRQERSHRALLPTRPLLVSESRRDFDAVYEALEKELMPQGIIERMYVSEIACIVWETVRLRSCRVALVNTAFRGAVQAVLERCLNRLKRYHYNLDDQADDEAEDEPMGGEAETRHGQADTDENAEDETEKQDDKAGKADDFDYDAELLATGWFTDSEVKGIVSKILRQFQLDESAIEAEAIKRCLPDLELLDKMLCTLEARLNKTLRCIAEYRESLARQLRESADRIIEGKNLLALEDPANKSAA